MKALLAAMILSAGVAHAAIPESLVNLKPAQGAVQIEAVGRPAMVKIKGKGEGPQGTLKVNGKTVSGEVKFSLNTLDTGIDLRNEHMKEKYLETGKHPVATLTIKELPVPEGWSKEKPQVKETPFKGELDLHGEKRTVEGVFEITGDKELKAKMELKISDYKIDIPSYLGVTVADTVKIQINSKDIF